MENLQKDEIHKNIINLNQKDTEILKIHVSKTKISKFLSYFQHELNKLTKICWIKGSM